MSAPTIITQFIEVWGLWVAMVESHDSPIGEGKTEPEAIADLKTKLEEHDDD